jgi:tetratricopeptide (TPR) repeat protein
VTRGRIALLVVGIAASSLVGCRIPRGDAFEHAFAAGQRAKYAGRYDEAARAFDEAARKAKRVKDRDEARYLEARAYEQAERFAEARSAYEKLTAYSPPGPRGERALFELAQLEIAHGDAARGRTMMLDATLTHPKAALARPSLIWLVRDAAASPGGEASAIALLDHIQGRLASTELDQRVRYERALCLDRLGHKQQAHDALVLTAQAYPYPVGSLTDDALLRAAELDVELGHYAHAIRDLRELLTTVETADTMGSYERPKFPRAQLLLAQVYRDGLGDHATARREFMKVYHQHTTSVVRDDALWQAARLARDDGDAADACELATLLVESLPESRYVSCATELCPAAKPPKGTRSCPDYLRRELDTATPNAPEAASATSRDD